MAKNMRREKGEGEQGRSKRERGTKGSSFVLSSRVHAREQARKEGEMERHGGSTTPRMMEFFWKDRREREVGEQTSPPDRNFRRERERERKEKNLPLTLTHAWAHVRDRRRDRSEERGNGERREGEDKCREESKSERPGKRGSVGERESKQKREESPSPSPYACRCIHKREDRSRREDKIKNILLNMKIIILIISNHDNIHLRLNFEKKVHKMYDINA